jgi:hypothetical protein
MLSPQAMRRKRPQIAAQSGPEPRGSSEGGAASANRASALLRASIALLASRASCPRTRVCECCARDESSCPRHGNYSRARPFISRERCVRLAGKSFRLARDIRLLAVEKMLLGREVLYTGRQSFPTRAQGYFSHEKGGAGPVLNRRPRRVMLRERALEAVDCYFSPEMMRPDRSRLRFVDHNEAEI